MLMKKIVSSLIGSKNGQTVENLEEILSVEEFRRFLEREIKKVDRNAHLFSLIIFEIKNQTKKMPQDLFFNLYERLRITDQIGWFNHYNIGIFLPDTTAEGAKKLADAIYNQTFFSFTIYTYPNDWFPRNNNNSKPKNDFDRNAKSSKEYRKKIYNRLIGKKDTIESNFLNPLPPWKRMFDLFMTSISLVFLSPLFLFMTIFIKLVSPGPVFFKQTRLGYLGHPFTFWKFRTMHVNADSKIHEKHMREIIKKDHQEKTGIEMVKLDKENDLRIIPFGKILRQSCLDELPQLLNVLRGEMSFVGPRPCMPYEAEEYQLWHTRRFDVIPGLTGSWQVNGKNKTTFKEMVRLDISYYLKRSFWGDLKILFKTFPAIIQLMVDGLSKNNA
jgi:lipopolysaccharide/colanic/teichoic acid biosynthesis glycosyltransferase